MTRPLITLNQLTEANGLVAVLLNARKKATATEETRLAAFKIEQRLRDLGFDPGGHHWPAPPTPEPPLADVLTLERRAA